MKYTISIESALPRERAAQLLAEPAHLPKWLRGLVLHEPLRGAHGQVGTTSRVVMQMGKQKSATTTRAPRSRNARATVRTSPPTRQNERKNAMVAAAK